MKWSRNAVTFSSLPAMQPELSHNNVFPLLGSLLPLRWKLFLTWRLEQRVIFRQPLRISASPNNPASLLAVPLLPWMPPPCATLGDTLKFFSFVFYTSCCCAIRKGKRFYPGLVCCDEHMCQNWMWLIIKVVQIVFLSAICWPWYIRIGSFAINYMAYSSGCWRAAVWRGTWVSWWTTGWPWASSVPWLPRRPMASWGA